MTWRIDMNLKAWLFVLKAWLFVLKVFLSNLKKNMLLNLVQLLSAYRFPCWFSFGQKGLFHKWNRYQHLKLESKNSDKKNEIFVCAMWATNNPWWYFMHKIRLMSGSCHLDRALNVEIGVEFQIFVIIIFFNCVRILQFGADSRYYKGALTQKRSF